ncbi:hypothetical protein J6R97_00690 [bacterium]|nr:hypothetical protein [bacterium]
MKIINKKIIKCIKDDFIVINDIDLDLQEIINIIRNFGDFSKLLVQLSQRRKEAENV